MRTNIKMTLMVSAIAMVLAGCSWFGLGTDDMQATSPDERNVIRLSLNPLSFEVLRDGKVVVGKTRIGLRLNEKRLETLMRENTPVVSTGRVMGKIFPEIYKKHKVFLSGYETVVDWGVFAVHIIARDDGVAYRFETKYKDKIRVNGERAGVKIPNRNARCWVNFSNRYGCEETVNQTLRAKDIATNDSDCHHIYLPFVYQVEGTTVAVAESDVYDYPVLNLEDDEQHPDAALFKAKFAGWPKRTHRAGGWNSSSVIKEGGRWVVVDKHEDWLVETEGTRTFPWRVFLLADTPAKLCEADAIYALARPAAEGSDFSWVKPGKVAWDWWNNFDNANSKTAKNGGCTTKTYERFIDFAAKNHVEYVIFDEGWSESLNIWKFHPEVDVPHLLEYAKQRGVGIILWMAWAQIVDNEEKVAEHFSKLGVKGFKVDFMDRGDAQVERFLWKFAEVCAKHHLVIDYHGAHHPTGMHRAFPNVLNYEGVHGLEQMKWHNNKYDFMANDLKVYFCRMTSGPMDYTPGAMDNYCIGKYTGNGDNPGSLGTRCRQMAMMVMYEAPLQMLSDSPTKYEKNQECFDFMAATPVVWDDTLGLDGDPDSHAVIARRSGNAWYVAGMTDTHARSYRLNSAFLGEGNWKMEIFRDANDSKTNPTHYRHEFITLRAGETFVFHMAPGGGFVVKFTK